MEKDWFDLASLFSRYFTVSLKKVLKYFIIFFHLAYKTTLMLYSLLYQKCEPTNPTRTRSNADLTAINLSKGVKVPKISSF